MFASVCIQSELCNHCLQGKTKRDHWGKICPTFKAKEQQQTNHDAKMIPMAEFTLGKKFFSLRWLSLVWKFCWPKERLWRAGQAKEEKSAATAKPHARPGRHSDSNLGWNRVSGTEVLRGADVIWLRLNQQTHESLPHVRSGTRFVVMKEVRPFLPLARSSH